jgi:glycosyl transferase family 25
MKPATIPGMKLMVINLARATQRLASVQELFAGAGLDFIRVDAVDAARLPRADLAAACPPVRFYLANARRARPGEIACTLSHKKCWQEAFADGTPLAAVFEDDVAFDAAGLRDALCAIAEENDPSLPTVWLLHKGLPKGRDLSARWYDIRTANDVARTWCAHCYALNAAAARRLADILTPMANVADAWSTYARCGVRVLAASRPCAATREEASSIERNTTRWRFKWVRDFYWFRYRMAFRLDLLIKTLSGKRRAKGCKRIVNI